MSYLITQIMLLLLLAAALGAALGWCTRGILASRARQRAEAGHRHQVGSLSLEISTLKMAVDRYRQQLGMPGEPSD